MSFKWQKKRKIRMNERGNKNNMLLVMFPTESRKDD